MTKRLMVVAHPDDELIFGGAHLLRQRNWTVICVTNAWNPLRAREFARAMRLVGAKYQIWKYEDTYSWKFNCNGLERDLLRVLRQGRYDKVVTHGLTGEYGHPQHIIIAKIMRKLVKSGLYVFSTTRKRLPPELLERKKKVLSLAYPSQRDIVQELDLHTYFSHECFRRVK